MPQIHPTAIVARGAMLAETAVIGPFCVVGQDVSLGPRVTLRSHVVVGGRTTIGEGSRLFPFASIGLEPQDLKYRGEDSELVIGRNNTIREYVTMNPGTEGAAWSLGSATAVSLWSVPMSLMIAKSATMSSWRTTRHWRVMSWSEITLFSAGCVPSTNMSVSAGTR